MLLVLGIIGMPGAGKGECAKIAQEAGIIVVNMGDLVREHTKNLGLELKDGNVGKIAHSEREKFGYAIWAKRTMEKIVGLNLKNEDLIVIDGIRGEAEVNVFLNHFTDRFKSIVIKMPAEKRFELLKQRKRSDAPMTQQEFEERDAREAKWGIQKAIDRADYILYNTGSLEELKRSFKELLSLIREQHL